MTPKDRVQELCDSKGISIYALEKELGLGQHTIRKWDKAKPNSDKLEMVASYFGVSTDYLLTGNTEDPDDETIRIAEELRRSPGRRMLFHSTRDFDEEEMMSIAKLIDSFKGKN